MKNKSLFSLYLLFLKYVILFVYSNKRLFSLPAYSFITIVSSLLFSIPKLSSSNTNDKFNHYISPN